MWTDRANFSATAAPGRRQPFMKSVAQLLLLICALITTAQGVPCIVESTNHGGGLFSYTFRRGDDPHVWGIRTNAGMIHLQAHGVLDVQNPPGWTHSISSSGVIAWTVTNGIVFLDEPVTFWLRSCLTESAPYSGITSGGPFAAISGSLYALPERTQILGGGYQAFDFAGPAPPTRTIQRRLEDVIVRWSSDVQGLRLEAADGLDLSGSWTSVINEVTIENGKFTVNLPAGESARFFHLVTPCTQAGP